MYKRQAERIIVGRDVYVSLQRCSAKTPSAWKWKLAVYGFRVAPEEPFDLGSFILCPNSVKKYARLGCNILKDASKSHGSNRDWRIVGHSKWRRKHLRWGKRCARLDRDLWIKSHEGNEDRQRRGRKNGQHAPPPFASESES